MTPCATAKKQITERRWCICKTHKTQGFHIHQPKLFFHNNAGVYVKHAKTQGFCIHQRPYTPHDFSVSSPVARAGGSPAKERRSEGATPSGLLRVPGSNSTISTGFRHNLDGLMGPMRLSGPQMPGRGADMAPNHVSLWGFQQLE